MTDRRLIHIAGGLTALLTVMHFIAPLGWSDTLKGLSRDDRAIMYELAYGFAVLLAMVAYVSLRHADQLVGSSMGRAVLVWVVLFWIARAIEGILLGEINAVPIALMCLGAALLNAVPLVRHHRQRGPNADSRTKAPTSAPTSPTPTNGVKSTHRRPAIKRPSAH